MEIDEIHLIVTDRFGRVDYKPNCETSAIFCRMAGTKTMNERMLLEAKKLNIKIHYQGEKSEFLDKLTAEEK